MGALDFLKALLPDIKIDIKIDNSTHIDNRKIELKDSAIIVAGQTIDDPRTVDAFYKRLNELSKEESLPFQLIHEDLFEDFIEFERTYNLSKDDLKLLKGSLPKDEMERLLMARRIALAYSDKKQADLIETLEEQLEDLHPKYGKRVYNLLAGGYFDELIIPFAKIHIERGTPEKFCKFYKEILEFFPLAIFVGNGTTEDKLKKDILRRLKLKGIPFIRIHAVGTTNIRKVMNVTDSVTKGFLTDDRRYTTTYGIQGQVFEINMEKIPHGK